MAQLAKARQEFSTLFEISNAMHKTLALDEILYIILTGVTSHSGLGFNRAILLLADAQGQYLEGVMGIGPDNGEEARRIWGMIDDRRMDLDDLVNAYGHSRQVINRSSFYNVVRNLRIPVKEAEGGILARAFAEAMPFHIRKENRDQFTNDPLYKIFDADEFVVVPLKARDACIGLIVADNIFTRRSITRDDIRVLTVFANQAGMAIENSKLYERALVRAHKDALTGLWNHGYFQRVLEDELRMAKEQCAYLSIIILDIDDFKNYNDTWGHQKGDEILVRLSGVLTDSSRKIDWVCRYGGEEFSIILPRASRRDATIIAERVRTQVEKTSFSSDPDHPLQRLTVSVGVASFPDDGNNKAELIKAADQALYEAKRQGKNRVVCAGPIIP
ncbi:MAG: diguanylate cyclase [Deltaproteobacteria bacterium]